MIKARCILGKDTTERSKESSWPTKFVAVPRIGEMVRSKEGILRKVSLIVYDVNMNGEPFVDVLLT